MPGRAVQVKRPPVVEKEKPPKPVSRQLWEMWNNNKFSCVMLAIIFVSWVAVMFFSRSNYIKSWAHSKGLSYDSSHNYKFGRSLMYFDAVARGQKSYAFNVMKGFVDYQNKSDADSAERTTVKAFDFAYTEVKTFQQNKRVTRMEKQHEFSALVFDADGYTFKSTIVTPRDMQVEGDLSDLPTQKADADTEELLKGPVKEKDEDDQKDPKKGKAEKKEGKKDEKKAEKKKPEAVVAVDKPPAATEEEPVKPFNETHPFSHKFNETFKIEAADHVQAAALFTPALKKILSDHPKFFVDFEEEQFMVYREYTIEPAEYSEALALGSAILGQLPPKLPVNETKPDKKEKKKEDENPMKVFVSKTEL